MAVSASIAPESFWQKDSFRFVKTEEFEKFGIDPSDIPVGTFAALKHPTHLPSRFGGNAYGFGLFELYDRPKPEDIKLLQSKNFDDPEEIAKSYKSINEIYARIGLLIRFSKLGKPYYLIPVHLASDTLTHIQSKVNEITKIVDFHGRKFLKEYHDIGLVADTDDLISRELSFRFKEHNFLTIDSLEKLQELNQPLDLIILTRDLYEIIFMEKFGLLSKETLTKKQTEQYAVYVLWKIYNALKPDGEIFVISNVYPPKTNTTAEVVFKTVKEEKLFSLFTHIFKTKKRYKPKGRPLSINIFDFQKYLSGLYVEQEVVNNLLKGEKVENMTLEQINKLAYLDYPLGDFSFLCEQEKTWPRLLSIYFNQIFFKPLVPQTVIDDWDRRFSPTDYAPKYMMIYLGQKKPLKTTVSELMRDVDESGLLGCPLSLLAGYRDRFSYVINTLQVLKRLKNGTYEGLAENFIDRLGQPLINKKRRFRGLNDVIKLISKIKKLEKIRHYLNPDNTEGAKTKILKNLEALSFFGFTQNELKEIIYIVYGHTPLGRIVSGKLSVKAFDRVLESTRSFDKQESINFLRYCRLMTMAEMEAATGPDLIREQVAELFDFYDAAVKVIGNRELDWIEVVDERIGAMGDIRNKVIRKILKMMSYYEFINNWAELGKKGRMEKEALADYNDSKLAQIENVIRLVNTVDHFEQNFRKSDHQKLLAFYRRILDKEYHGTGYLFERMDSHVVFALLAITANISGVEIINFNPLLAGVKIAELDARVKMVEREALAISARYLDLNVLDDFSKQLHRHKFIFIVGTGFNIEVDSEAKTLEFAWLDVDNEIKRLKALSEEIGGYPISDISSEELKSLEDIFSELDSFYQSHLRFIEETKYTFKLPSKQEPWVQKVKELRDHLRSKFLSLFFLPKDIYTNLERLYRYAPKFLDFILPEFTALHDRVVTWHLYMTSPVTQYIIAAVRKLQALITHDRKNFQDVDYLYRLAQREFGPMATGTVGVSDSQIKALEKIVDRLSNNPPLFEALIKSLIFQDMGRLPALREKYKDEINPAELTQASALFIEKEGIAQTYSLDDEQKAYLIFLVRHHSLLHHIVRGEFAIPAIAHVLDTKDKDLFDAFFVFSFIMLCAIRDDLIREDLADQLFKTKAIADGILDNKSSVAEKMDSIFFKRGDLFYALEYYRTNGLPDGMSPTSYLNSHLWGTIERATCIRAGKMISAVERVFRLRGIRHIKYLDLVNLMIKVPLKYIYKERKLSSIGYASFEKELFEAFRIFNTIRILPDKARIFILAELVDDKVRIFGYEKVSNYLSYKNQIKLLLLALLGTTQFDPNGPPICLNFLGLCDKIEKRYEAVNDYLNRLSSEALMEEAHSNPDRFYNNETGLMLRKETFPNVCTIDFQDSINISQKLSYMNAINDMEQLKTYFHSSVRSLRNHPFATDDYQEELSKAFEMRKMVILDRILNKARQQMDLIHDFKELHNLAEDFLGRSKEVGFSDDQKHRLNDLYELRKETLTTEKLSEINGVLGTISDVWELKDYWDSIKGYLQGNRHFFGKEFEITIAERFDDIERRLKGEIW